MVGPKSAVASPRATASIDHRMIRPRVAALGICKHPCPQAGRGDGGTQPPRLRPYVILAVVRDLDLRRFGFRTLRDRYFKNAVLVRGLDRVLTDICRKPEGPMDSAVMAFRAMNPRVLRQYGTTGSIRDVAVLRVGAATRGLTPAASEPHTKGAGRERRYHVGGVGRPQGDDSGGDATPGERRAGWSGRSRMSPRR